MMDAEGKVSQEEFDSIEHHRKVMNTALDLLRQFKARFKRKTPFNNRPVSYGRMESRRCGKRRIIQFLQVGEEAGDLELRIEIFIVRRGEE